MTPTAIAIATITPAPATITAIMATTGRGGRPPRGCCCSSFFRWTSPSCPFPLQLTPTGCRTVGDPGFEPGRDADAPGPGAAAAWNAGQSNPGRGRQRKVGDHCGLLSWEPR